MGGDLTSTTRREGGRGYFTAANTKGVCMGGERLFHCYNTKRMREGLFHRYNTKRVSERLFHRSQHKSVHVGGYFTATTLRERVRGYFSAANIRKCVWEVISLLQHEGR